MGHHFVSHILITRRDASSWLIWVPTPAGSRRGRMWAQASHIELRWHEVNITECFTHHHVTSPPWSCSPGHHRTPPRLAHTSCWLIFWRLVTGTCEEKVETLQSLVSGSSPRLPGKHLVSHLSFSKFGFWWGTTTLPSLQYYKTNTMLHNDNKEDNISL